MTTASDTPAPTPVAATPAPPSPVRDWCCGTDIKGPHLPGCPSEPREDQPIDYNGPAVIAPAAASPEPAEPKPATPPKPPAWPHQTIEFQGATLEVRIPTATAIVGLRNILVQDDGLEEQESGLLLFLRHHVSPRSRRAIQEQMIDPDQEGFTASTPFDLAIELMNLGDRALTEAAEAEKAAAEEAAAAAAATKP